MTAKWRVPVDGAVRSIQKRLPFCVAWLSGCLAFPAAAQFLPNESLASPNPALIDFEFSQGRAKFAWTDPNGNLWLAGVNRDTGAFEPLSGRGTLITTGTVSKVNEFLWNGPEWLSTAAGDQLFFSYYLPNGAPTAANTRMAIAVQDKNGNWITQPLGPNVPRMSHIASKDARDAQPHVKYLDPNLNQYWRNAFDAASETLMPFIPPSNKSWRFASGARALLYALPVNGTQQVFSYALDSQVNQQLTFDAGDKDIGRTVPWMWQAPEFGGEFVLSTFVNNSELRVYRSVAGWDGAANWTSIYSASLPDGTTANSPEFFVYNGKSYVFMAAMVSPNNFPSEIWVSNINAAQPLFRRITDNSLLRTRNDPEVFVTNQGPRIYYNRYDPSIDPDHPLCSACSEGVFKADPGLAGL